MEVLLAILVGFLYAAGVYLMLRRSIVKLLFGLALLGNATNLLIFVAAGLQRGRPAFVPIGATEPKGPVADPLAQALILTAIVIGFGLLAFATVLTRRVYDLQQDDDLDALSGGEEDA